jgi:hypothetical protein
MIDVFRRLHAGVGACGALGGHRGGRSASHCSTTIAAFYSLTPLGLNFTRRKIYHFLDKALETGTDSKPPH